MSTVVTRATSSSAPRGATPTRTRACGACASNDTRARSPAGSALATIGQATIFSSATGRHDSALMSTSASPGSHSTTIPPPAHSAAIGHTSGSHPAPDSAGFSPPSPRIGSGATAVIVTGAIVPRDAAGSRTAVVPATSRGPMSAGRTPARGRVTVTDSGDRRGSASTASSTVRHGAVGTNTAVTRTSPRPMTARCQQPNCCGDSFVVSGVNATAARGPTSIRQIPSPVGPTSGPPTTCTAPASPSTSGDIPAGSPRSMRVRSAGRSGTTNLLPSSGGGSSHWKR